MGGCGGAASSRRATDLPFQYSSDTLLHSQRLAILHFESRARPALTSNPSRTIDLLKSLSLRLLRRSGQRMYLLHAGD